MKKLQKLMITLFILLMILGTTTTSVFAWGPTDQPDSSWNCSNVNDAINFYQGVVDNPSTSAQYFARFSYLLEEAKKYKQQNCSCVDNGIYWVDTGYRQNNGSVIGRFAGDVFCIEKSQLFNKCGAYTDSTGSYNEGVAKAIAAYNKIGGGSNEYYAATQYLVWIAMGQVGESDIPGSLQGAVSNLRNTMNEGVEIHHSMNVSPSSFELNLGDQKVVTIENYGSYGKNVDGSAATGLGLTSVSSDKLTATLNSIYPLTKKVKINGKDRVTSGGTLTGTMTIKTSPTSQDFAMFEGKFASLRIDVYDPAEFTVKTNTGSLELHKFDEWGDNAGPNIKFQIWYAKEDPDGTALDDDGKTYSKYLPYVYDTNPTEGAEPTTFTTNDNGFFNIISNMASTGGKFADGTPTGYYIIEETEVTQSFVENTTVFNGKETVSYAFHINKDGTTTINVENDRRTVKETIVKYDAEEPGEMDSEKLYLNDAEFTVYDMSVEKDLSIDTVNGSYHTKEVPILRVGKSADLNSLIGGIDVTYRIKNEHCNTATLDGSTLTANEPDVVVIEVLDGDTVLSSVNVYQIAANDNSVISSLDSNKLTGLPVFRGLTGHAYIQLVDHDTHNLPLRNKTLKIYEDAALTTEIAELTSDDFGMIDLKDIAEEHDVIYYKDPVNNAIKEKVTKVDKGTLDIEYLRHSRYYLIAESKTPDNYDIERDTKYNSPNGIVTSDKSPVYVLHTNFDKGVSDHTTELTNMKVRGDLKMTKLDEFERLSEPGTKFKIYHAALIDNSLSYEMNYQNVLFEADGTTPVRDLDRGSIVNPKTGDDIFTVGDDSAFEIMDYLYYGYYVLEEVEASNAYDLNDALMLFDIRHSEKSEIEYTNTNRTVSFQIYKNDIEEEYRYLEGAEFTIYDITSPIGGSWKKNDLENKNLDFEFLYTIKAGKSVNLRNLYLEYHPEVAEEVGNLPLRFELNHTEMGLIDTNNIFTSNGEAGKTTIKAVGGNYQDIYAKFVGDDMDELGNVYLGSTFNPNEISFFYDNEGEDEMNPLEFEVLESTVEADTLGTYSVIYRLIDRKGVECIFDRVVRVIEDDRPVFDVDENVYKDPITNKVVDDPKPIEPKIIKLFDAKEQILPEGYEGKDFGSFDLYTLVETGLSFTNKSGTSVNLTENDVTIFEGVKVFRGTTGRKEIQIVDHKHHNLPLSQEVTLYLDENCLIELGTFETEDSGMIDLTDVELAPETIKVGEDEYVVATTLKLEELTAQELEDMLAKYDDSFTVGIVQNSDIIKYGTEEFDGILLKEELYTGEITVLKEYVSTDYADDIVYYTDKYDEVRKIVIDFDETYKNTKANYLKHSRNYLVVETKLPVGYDYVEDQNPMFVLDTYQYDIGVDGKDTTIGNMLRRIDLVLYKTNASKSVKLNGAVFDIWDAFEEGVDQNVTKHIKNVALTNQETEYDLEIGKVFEVTKEMELEEYEEYLDATKYVIIDENGDEYGSDEYALNHTVEVEDDSEGAEEGATKEVLLVEGDVYEIYVPDIKDREYLGRYVSGGIYVTEKDALAGAEIIIATDKEMENVIKTVSLSKDGTAKILGLPMGKYYYCLQRPLSEDFEAITYEAPEGYTKVEDENDPNFGKAVNDLDPEDVVELVKIVHIPTEADRVPLDELPECYGKLNVAYIADGMIMLPQIKYSHTIVYKEIEAPAGYYFDGSLTTVENVAEYGINRIENFRINNAIIINNGVRF